VIDGPAVGFLDPDEEFDGLGDFLFCRSFGAV
jgi:hypothetical protein